MMNKNELFETAVTAILRAGEAIMLIYRQDNTEINYKPDHSPLTQADLTASDIICRYLETTGIPIICEETSDEDYEVRKHWKTFWIVDPLDGTKEFIKRNDEFTVNIALVENGEPVMGLVSIPALDCLYWGEVGVGSYKTTISSIREFSYTKMLEKAEKLPVETSLEVIKVMVSRSHIDEHTLSFVEDLKKRYPKVETISAGSSLKFCYIAEGKADIYLRFSPTMEWDTAAGHAVAIAAGVHIRTLPAREKLLYNKPDLHNTGFVVTRMEDIFPAQR
jgi:3'(2'), 5'-bisphosphate nucleotidase